VPDVARGAVVLAGVILMLGAGTHLYLRRELPRGWVIFFNALPFYYRGNVYALIPYGVGFSLIGIGALIARQPYLNVFVMAGLACCMVGVGSVIWHPNWIRPRSMRGPGGD